MRIYLSPSNQPHNAYTGVSTNEKIEMEGVAQRVKAILEKNYIVDVVMATLSMGIGKSERPTECKNADCDIYCAIHSNAGGGGKAVGAVAFYHPNSEVAKALATEFVKELDAIAPVKSNRYSSVKNGMDAYNGVGYGEIRSPMQLGVPSVLVEVNFHDNATVAKWIVAHKDEIAEAIVRAFVTVYKLERKVSPPAEAEKKLYRVQTGAYKNKEYADKLADKLERAGFDTYMVQSGKYYKVQVGAYQNKDYAKAMAEKLNAAGFSTYITTKGGTAVDIAPPAQKTVDELAREVIAGKWGNGATRKKRLTDAGYDYSAVQTRVNELLK